MKKALSVFVSLFGLCLTGYADDITWTQDFVFSAIPSELSPDWKGHNQPGAIGEEGVVVDSAEHVYSGWFFNHGAVTGAWDGGKPTTVEFRLSVHEVYPRAAGGGAGIAVSDGMHTYRFSFRNRDSITYRITIEDGRASLYHQETPDGPFVLKDTREGKENFGESSGPVSANSISFGALASNVRGVSEWEFIRWTNEEAWEP